MSDGAEAVALAAAIKKIDKKVKWREERIALYREEIASLGTERDALADRYAALMLADREGDG